MKGYLVTRLIDTGFDIYIPAGTLYIQDAHFRLDLHEGTYKITDDPKCFGIQRLAEWHWKEYIKEVILDPKKIKALTEIIQKEEEVKKEVKDAIRPIREILFPF